MKTTNFKRIGLIALCAFMAMMITLTGCSPKLPDAAATISSAPAITETPDTPAPTPATVDPTIAPSDLPETSTPIESDSMPSDEPTSASTPMIIFPETALDVEIFRHAYVMNDNPNFLLAFGVFNCGNFISTGEDQQVVEPMTSDTTKILPPVKDGYRGVCVTPYVSVQTDDEANYLAGLSFIITLAENDTLPEDYQLMIRYNDGSWEDLRAAIREDNGWTAIVEKMTDSYLDSQTFRLFAIFPPGADQSFDIALSDLTSAVQITIDPDGTVAAEFFRKGDPV